MFKNNEKNKEEEENSWKLRRWKKRSYGTENEELERGGSKQLE